MLTTAPIAPMMAPSYGSTKAQPAVMDTNAPSSAPDTKNMSMVWFGEVNLPYRMATRTPPPAAVAVVVAARPAGKGSIKQGVRYAKY